MTHKTLLCLALFWHPVKLCRAEFTVPLLSPLIVKLVHSHHQFNVTMEQHLRRRDKAVLTALVVLLVAVGAAVAILYFTQRADNAFTAMARGQYKLARHFYEQEIEAGSPQAMNQLANLHYLGLGAQSNHETAAKLYLDASSAGHAAVSYTHLTLPTTPYV